MNVKIPKNLLLDILLLEKEILEFSQYFLSEAWWKPVKFRLMQIIVIKSVFFKSRGKMEKKEIKQRALC